MTSLSGPWGGRRGADAAASTRAGVAAVEDFSLVLGGPLFQLLRRVRLSDDALGLAHRRIVAAILFLWAPLVAFSALQGGLLGPAQRAPFLHDVGFQARFLLVVPLLIVSELVVHRRMRSIVEEFTDRRLVRPAEYERFAEAVGELVRWRNSVLAEVVLLIIVYAAGLLFTFHRYMAMGGDGWYSAPSGGLSYAGLWLVFVSLPLLQFLLLRWYFRLLIWGRFLWRMSRMDLDLDVAHPDRAGGLGFLAESLVAFTPIALAHGVLVAGAIADRIFYTGARLTDFQLEVIGGVILLTAFFTGPLTVFAPRMEHVKRTGLREYGALGQTYVKAFRRKWVDGKGEVDEPLLGSADIQSLADLGNSFGAAEQMRLAPVKLSAVLFVVAAFLAPIAPLLLTIMPAEQIVDRLVGLVF